MLRLPIADVARQARGQADDGGAGDGFGRDALKRANSRRRLDARLDRPAAARVEAQLVQGDLHGDAQQLQVRRPGALQEMTARAGLDVRAPRDGNAAGAAGQCQGQIDGMQDQAGGAGGSDGERVIAALNLSRQEVQRTASQAGAAQARPPNPGRGVHAHDMLGLHAGPGAAGPDVAQAERFARDQRQCQAGAENLPAPFAQRTVNVDWLVIHGW